MSYLFFIICSSVFDPFREPHVVRTGLELEVLKALNSGLGPHRSRRPSSMSRRPSFQSIRHSSKAWDVHSRPADEGFEPLNNDVEA